MSLQYNPITNLVIPIVVITGVVLLLFIGFIAPAYEDRKRQQCVSGWDNTWDDINKKCIDNLVIRERGLYSTGNSTMFSLVIEGTVIEKINNRIITETDNEYHFSNHDANKIKVGDVIRFNQTHYKHNCNIAIIKLSNSTTYHNNAIPSNNGTENLVSHDKLIELFETYPLSWYSMGTVESCGGDYHVNYLTDIIDNRSFVIIKENQDEN